MSPSLRNERLRWLLVMLIGLLISSVISTWNEESDDEPNISQVNAKLQSEDIQNPAEQIISKCFPNSSDQPRDFFRLNKTDFFYFQQNIRNDRHY